MRIDSVIPALVVLLLLGCAPREVPGATERLPAADLKESSTASLGLGTEERGETSIDFSQFHPSFRFAADIPTSWKVEFVPEIVALNIYDPTNDTGTKREQSQLFIRFFEANSFLTLSSVTILSREETSVRSHDAVRYEIEKKAGVAPFPHQPSWRSGRHRLVDVRLTASNPSLFFVFASHPSLDPAMFEGFLHSLRFHNDRESYRPPLPQAQERITKKPFGLEVSPDRSPVEPERFSGFHSGVDLEILPGEESDDVTVSAICGGKLRLKQRAEGYGGVVVQECILRDNTVTVVYGHLALHSITATVGDYLSPGARIGLLGAAGSEETDGERKHLHLAIHRGRKTEIAGYVPREEQLSEWIDPEDLF